MSKHEDFLKSIAAARAAAPMPEAPERSPRGSQEGDKIVLSTWVTSDEREAFQALLGDQSLSSWIRRVLNEEVARRR